jgi:phosphate transport system permease protein
MFAPATTITSKIASELYEATSTLHISSLMELALILLVVTILINSVSRVIINRRSKREYF